VLWGEERFAAAEETAIDEHGDEQHCDHDETAERTQWFAPAEPEERTRPCPDAGRALREEHITHLLNVERGGHQLYLILGSRYA
jgi:hypothetical protein